MPTITDPNPRRGKNGRASKSGSASRKSRRGTSSKKRRGSKANPKNRGVHSVDQITDDWAQWQQIIGRRKRRMKPLSELLNAGRKSAMVWGIQPDSICKSDLKQIQSLRKIDDQGTATAAQSAAAWESLESMEESLHNGGSFELNDSLILISLVHSVHGLIPRWSAADWERFVRIIAAATGIGESMDRDSNALGQLLLAVELPVAWGYQFPELSESQDGRDRAYSQWEDMLADLVDGDGAVRRPTRETTGGFVASCCRVTAMIRVLGDYELSKDSRLRLEWLMRNAFRWARPDGMLWLDDPQHGQTSWNPRLVDAIVAQSRDKDDAGIACSVFAAGRAKRKSVNLSDLPESSGCSEWAENAVLRSSWHSKADVMAVDFYGRDCSIELFRSHSLLRGAVACELTFDGTTLQPTSDWSCVCWHDDDDVSFLEIEQEFGPQVAIQRQFLLAKQDRVALVADAVLAKEEALVDYRFGIDMANGIEWIEGSESREGLLHDGKKGARVLPLAAPEWRRQPSAWELSAHDGRVTLAFQGRVRRSYCPLLIDLSPQRSRSAFTWRQLTVASDLEMATPSEAVGFRIQIGDEQWLIYRALGPVVPRSILGQHLMNEFYVGQFYTDGEVIELLSVDPAE